MNQKTIQVTIEGNILTIKKIRQRMTANDIQEIDLSLLNRNKEYFSTIKLTKEAEQSQLFYFEKCEIKQLGQEDFAEISDEADITAENAMPVDNYLMIYSRGYRLCYAYGDAEKLMAKLVTFKTRVLSVKMNKKKMSVLFTGYLIKRVKNLDLGAQCLYISDKIQVPCEVPVLDKGINKFKLLNPKFIRKVTVDMDAIVADPDVITQNIVFSVDILGFHARFGLPKKKMGVRKSRKYYTPVCHAIKDDYMVFVRRNNTGHIALVMRLLDPYEKTARYRFWESSIVSGALYYIGKIARKLSRKIVNVYYEKETMKAEEGTYEVFSLARNESTSRNYFIIDEHSADYPRIKDEKNIVKKFSAKYYWLYYRANNAIATEATAHMNILRSGNKYIRLRNIEMTFAFLQHGVTYMKCHGAASAYIAGKENQPQYMFVGSEKERDVTVDMLKLKEQDIFITGLPIFSTIEYEHINETSDDFVTIMLTFKPYEERLDGFEESRYYTTIIALYDILKKYIAEEKIYIIAHPRIHYLLEKTDLKDRMYNGSISEVLKKTKLMITDYSSVAYNSFYQGAAVMFYQEDIVEYEAFCGELIPTDDEYIGMRSFSLEEFEKQISDILVDGKVDLSVARTEKMIENYSTINSFHDGKNAERIYEQLKKIKLI